MCIRDRQYIEEEGRYPERIAMIFWSGTNMRTKGCDIAQAMALLGVSERIHQTKYLALGSPSAICGEEGWNKDDVH